MLVLLEGMDKTGKSTVAQALFEQGYHYIHMSAPRQCMSREQYLAEMLQAIASTIGTTGDCVIDRTWYGEMVWPYAYNRHPLLGFEDCQLLTNVAALLHGGQVRRILMHDPDAEAHKARLVKFKEPSYNYDLVRRVYEDMAMLANFELITFQQAEAIWKLNRK